MDSRERDSLKSYNRNVTEIVNDSDEQISKQFFQLLSSDNNDTALEVEEKINQLRTDTDKLLDRVEKLDVPSAMEGAQQNLIVVFELRRDALTKIASKIPTALGKRGANKAKESISAQMQSFLASDVIYAQRVVPRIQKALKDSGVGGQTIASSRFLSDLSWFNPDVLSDRLGSGSSSSSDSSSGDIAPGLHGFGLISASADGTPLQTDSLNRITVSSNIPFSIGIANQGENDESDVKVKLTISGSGDPITVTKTVDEVQQGAEETVNLPLDQAPPIGEEIEIEVEVEPVPGEEKADNNAQTYPAIFVR